MAAMGLAQSTALTLFYRLKNPTDFNMPGRWLRGVNQISVSFQASVQWASQVVQFEATNAIYDYVRGRVRLGPGKNSYTIRNVDFETAVPLADAPPVEALAVGVLPGEVDMVIVRVRGNGVPNDPIPLLPAITDLVAPEDLVDLPPLGFKKQQ
jgi:hypothetical protein